MQPYCMVDTGDFGMTQAIRSKVAQRRIIGRRGLQVSGLGLGTAPLGGLYSDLSDEQALATVAAAYEAGVRFFDTAPHYGHTKAEHRLGDALRRYPRDRYVLSTKTGRHFVPRTTPYDGSEGWQDPLPFQAIFDYTHDGILRSFEDSQQRLGIVEIDILLIHDIGRVTHGEKNPHYWKQLTEGGGFRALDELRSAGVVKAVGLGVNEGAAILEVMADFDIDCALLAGRYTLLEQATLDDLLPACEAKGVSLLLGGAFNSGILARGVQGDLKFNYVAAPKEVIERVARLEAVCREHDVPLAAAALQFPYAHPAVATVLTGARSVEELRENVASFERPIPAELWTALRDKGLLDPRAPVPKD
jgi:D-threo-aldose 1-dehydrogenase